MTSVRVPAHTLCVLLFVIGALSAAAGGASAQSLPTPWVGADIGSPALAGSSASASGTFTITAAGADIWDSADQFHFIYRQVSGDVEVVARVDSLTHAHPWTKAGVMIRASLSAGAPHGFALLSAERGIAFQRRTAAHQWSAHTTGGTGTAPRWLRIRRVGTLVTAYASADGINWRTIGSDVIALGTSVYVGLAVTSHDAAVRATGRFSQVAVSAPGLPPPLQSRDVGSPALRGAAVHTQGSYAIDAAGADIWGSADQFHFVYHALSGDVEVLARVASVGHTHAWAKAGVMIRESLSAGSAHAFALVSAGNGYAFQRRTTAGGLSDHTPGGGGRAPVWLRLVRTGTRIEAFRSSDGASWTSMGSDSIAMGATVYVGMAVTSHDVTASTRAVLDGFRVTPVGGPANRPPAVALTAPANGATYVAPGPIGISASASDPEGRLARVELYAGSTRLATVTSAPHSFTWASAPAGVHVLQAVAFDTEGASGVSAQVSVTVTASTVTPPRWVVFNASADHATVNGYRLEVFAAGADPAVATPHATSDLGKPAPNAAGEIQVDRQTFFGTLAPGSYRATVLAVGPSGTARSTPVDFTR